MGALTPICSVSTPDSCTVEEKWEVSPTRLSILLLVMACSKQSGMPPPGSHDTPFTIVATDSGFTLPDTLHSGLNHFIYENRGRQIHECMFIRLPDGMSLSRYVSLATGGIAFPEGALDCSGVGLTSPGERVEAWVPLEEGRYMIGCWNSDHMETRRPVGVIVHGAPSRPVEPPHEDITVRMVDFRYEVVGALKSGEQTIRFETVGPSMHETDILRLDEGRGVADARAWFENQELPAPGTFLGGCLDSHDLKRVVWTRRTFPRGHFLLWCDMPMIQTAQGDTTAAHVNHSDAGMVKELTID